MSYLEDGWFFYTATIKGVVYLAKGHTSGEARAKFEHMLEKDGLL